MFWLEFLILKQYFSHPPSNWFPFFFLSWRIDTLTNCWISQYTPSLLFLCTLLWTWRKMHTGSLEGRFLQIYPNECSQLILWFVGWLEWFLIDYAFCGFSRFLTGGLPVGLGFIVWCCCAGTFALRKCNTKDVWGIGIISLYFTLFLFVKVFLVCHSVKCISVRGSL